MWDFQKPKGTNYWHCCNDWGRKAIAFLPPDFENQALTGGILVITKY